MEDEGFVDDEFIEDGARECVALHGENAVGLLRERARIAEAAGNSLMAQAWHDMADAAERILT
jgi:hypothetical protein